MPHTTILFVHLQYDAPDSPQSRALRALAATVVRTTAPPLYLVGGYAYETLTPTVSPWPLPERCAPSTRPVPTRPWRSSSRRMWPALAAAQMTVTPLLRAGAPQTVLAQVARTLDAALVLVGMPQNYQGFAIALGGSYEALQAALPCRVCRAIPPAAGHPRGQDQGHRAPARVRGWQAA
jgi:hypothetical protein